VQRGVNEALGIDGVLLTMYDARLNLSRQVAADAREYFGPKVFKTVIPRTIRLAEAPSFGKPIILYDVSSVGAQAYMGVARELIERFGKKTSAYSRQLATAANERASAGPSERAGEAAGAKVDSGSAEERA
jgi:chromosome partitioning protein